MGQIGYEIVRESYSIEIIEKSYRGSYTPPFMNGLQLRENVSEEWHRNYYLSFLQNESMMHHKYYRFHRLAIDYDS